MAFKRIDEGARSQISVMYRAGLSMEQIEGKLGIGHSTISRELNRAGLASGKPGVSGIRYRRHGNSKHFVKESAFDDPTPAACYWAGFLMAESYVNDRENRIQIVTAKRDREHLEACRSFFGFSGELTAGSAKVRPGTQSFPYCALTLASVRLRDAIASLGIIQGNQNRIPREDLLLDRDFWRGCIDGDGSVLAYHYAHGSKFLVVLCAWPKLADCFRHFCNSIGVSLHKPIVHPKIVELRASAVNARRLASYLYRSGDVALARKAAVAAEMAAIGISAADTHRLRSRAGKMGAAVTARLRELEAV